MKNLSKIILKSLSKASLVIPCLLLFSALIEQPFPVLLFLAFMVIFFVPLVMIEIFQIDKKDTIVRLEFEHILCPLIICLIVLPFILIHPAKTSFLYREIDVLAIIRLILKQPVMIQIIRFFKIDLYFKYYEVLSFIVITFIWALKRNVKRKHSFLFTFFIGSGIISNGYFSGDPGVLLSAGGMLTPVIILLLLKCFKFKIGSRQWGIAITLGAMMGPLFILPTMVAFLIIRWLLNKIYPRVQVIELSLIRFYLILDPALPGQPVYNNAAALVSGAFLTLIGFMLMNYGL
jgi:hypothetical protein